MDSVALHRLDAGDDDQRALITHRQFDVVPGVAAVGGVRRDQVGVLAVAVVHRRAHDEEPDDVLTGRPEQDGVVVGVLHAAVAHAVVEHRDPFVPGPAAVQAQRADDVAHVHLAAHLQAIGGDVVLIGPSRDERLPDLVVRTSGVERVDGDDVLDVSSVRLVVGGPRRGGLGRKKRRGEESGQRGKASCMRKRQDGHEFLLACGAVGRGREERLSKQWIRSPTRLAVAAPLSRARRAWRCRMVAASRRVFLQKPAGTPAHPVPAAQAPGRTSAAGSRHAGFTNDEKTSPPAVLVDSGPVGTVPGELHAGAASVGPGGRRRGGARRRHRHGVSAAGGLSRDRPDGRVRRGSAHLP